LLAGCTIGTCMLLSIGQLRSRARLERLKSTGSVHGDAEVASKRGADI